MLSPVIMIGCGGSGQKAVRYIRDAVRRRLVHAGWEGEFPRSWQFIGLDTLESQESPGEIPTMPASDYKSVSLKFPTYSALESTVLSNHKVGSAGYKELIGWRPVPQEVIVPLQKGAAQLRAVGRMAGLLSLNDIVKTQLLHAFTECITGGPELQRVSERLGVATITGAVTPKPLVIVLGSMAGGTGAGIMLDVIDLIRRTSEDGAFPIGIVFSADIFGNKQTDMMAANGLAFMSELMSSYWDNEPSGLALIPSIVPIDQRGPHAVFMVGRRNMDGLDLLDSKQVYRAVGEALSAWVTSSQVQTQVINFSLTNWSNYAPANMGGYGFGEEYTRGVISSFGASTVSIGRDRFREYSMKLLMREILETQYEGFLTVAQRELGDAAKNLGVDAKIARIVENNIESFLKSCEVHERGKSNNQITDVFASKDIVSDMLARVSSELRSAFGGQQLLPDQWYRSLISQAGGVVKPAALNRAEVEVSQKLSTWGSEIFERILRASSKYSGRLSMPVTLEIARAAQREISEVSGEVRQEARDFREQANSKIGGVQGPLMAAGKGKIGTDSKPVQDAVTEISKSIVLEMKAIIFERIALTMDALASQVFAQLAGALQQGIAQAQRALVPQDGNTPIAGSWPKNDGSVPESFSPSPVEFYLEEHQQWPERLKELIARSMPISDPDEVLPVDPVQAACYLIVKGGKAGGSYDSGETPLIWSEAYLGGRPQWSPGNTPSITVALDHELLEERVSRWMKRPATPLAGFLVEGLQTYLSATDRAGTAIPDHFARIDRFRVKVQEALSQSKPLMQIDSTLAARVHPMKVNTVPIVQGFPFGVNHPARKIVEDILKVALPPGTSLNEYFSDVDAESVLISSFLEYPVHPAVVTSFTQPITTAVGNLNGSVAQTRGNFWLWRRAKVLEDFLPLPDEMRRSIIRGFAVARLLGFVTADPSVPVKISTDKGVLEFPSPLLTQVGQDNILPALLEAFVLTFASVTTIGEAAFKPYKRLYEIGSGVGAGVTFTAIGELKDFIESGSTAVTPVDEARRKSFTASTKEERCLKMVENLDTLLRRYNLIKGTEFTGQEHRTKTGNVVPEDTLSHELINDLIRCYGEVKAAIEVASVGSAT